MFCIFLHIRQRHINNNLQPLIDEPTSTSCVKYIRTIIFFVFCFILTKIYRSLQDKLLSTFSYTLCIYCMLYLHRLAHRFPPTRNETRLKTSSSQRFSHSRKMHFWFISVFQIVTVCTGERYQLITVYVRVLPCAISSK